MKVRDLRSRPFASTSGRRTLRKTLIGITSYRAGVHVICTVEGCGKPHEAKGFCKAHYRKFKTYGDPLAGRTKRPSGPCEIKDCPEMARRNGLCNSHSRQMRTHGDPLIRERRKRGTGYIRDDGYMQLGKPDHPLADSRGIVYIHRMVLFDAIGWGPHPCHWCAKPVGFQVKKGPGGWGTLIVDHADFNTSNNVLTNLLVSCNPCNATRQRKYGDRPHVSPRHVAEDPISAPD